MLKCHQCGIEVSANCGVRRSVHSGYNFGGINQVQFSEVFLCAPCAVELERSRGRVVKLWLGVFGALALIYFLGSMIG